MALVNAEIKMQGNDNAFFTTNAAVVYPANIQIFHTDGRYKFTDGVTDLATLPFLGSGGGGAVETVTGTNVDNTDPLNPIVLEQTTIAGETIETQNNKGQANGYVELDGSNRILFPAQSSPTIKSILRNINSASRNYIFPDKAGTMAMIDDANTYTNYTTPLDTDKTTIFETAASTLRSLTWANIKATLKTYFDALYQTQLNTKVGVIAKDIATSSALTGTTAITLVRSILIPANTFTTGDVCQIIHRGIRSTATGTGTNYIYINTSASLSGATLVGTQGAASRFYSMERNLFIKSSTVSETYDVSGSLSSDNPAVAANDKADLNINWTVDQYIIHAFSLAAVGNSFVSSGIIVTKI
jgi:hypothetical protein